MKVQILAFLAPFFVSISGDLLVCKVFRNPPVAYFVSEVDELATVFPITNEISVCVSC